MDIVRIKQFDKEHPNAYARVEWTDIVEGTICVSNANMPFQGTFSQKVLKLDEVEYVRGIGA